MAVVIGNPSWGMVSGRQSAVVLRNDFPPLANFLYKNRNRLASPFGPSVLSIGSHHLMEWAYQMVNYVPPVPDPVGGLPRPTVGQLTP